MPDKKEPRWDAARAAWVVDTDEGPVLADPQPPAPKGVGWSASKDYPFQGNETWIVPPAAKLTL
jgi:hypothetical protein